jgi:O-acetyl-ADP-ribose deacetylase (regulator of RNase III)
MIRIDVRSGDILDFEGDAILVPTASDGRMTEGLAARIKQRLGNRVEAEVVAHAPIAVGAALLTSAGEPLKVKHLIHSPVVETTGQRTGVENIRRCTRAGLLCVRHYRLERIGIPGLGQGDLGVPEDEAARAILDEINGFRTSSHPTTITLIDEDPIVIDAFEALLGSR